MTVYAPTPVELGSITIPADGESIEAADVNVPLSAIADGVVFLDGFVRRATMLVPASAYVGRSASLAAASIASTHGTGISNQGFATRDMTPTMFLNNATVINTGADTAYIYLWNLDDYLIDGATLASVIMRFRGAGAHAALPALMPEINVARTARTGTTAETLKSTNNGWLVDTAPDLATFILERDFVTFTPDQNNVIDLDAYTYKFFYHDGGGANALVGNSVFNIKLGFTY